MAETYRATIMEMEGDPDSDNVLLGIESEAVATLVAADSIAIEVLTRRNGNRIVTLFEGAAGDGDFTGTVYEMEGDPDTSRVLYYVPKEVFGDVGDPNITFLQSGDSLVCQLPPATTP